MIKPLKQIREYILRYSYISQLLRTQVNPLLVTELFYDLCDAARRLINVDFAICFIICTLLEKSTENAIFF